VDPFPKEKPALQGQDDALNYFRQLDEIEKGRRLVAHSLYQQHGYHLLTAYIQTRLVFAWGNYFAYKCSQGTPLLLLDTKTGEIVCLNFEPEQWNEAEKVNRLHVNELVEEETVCAPLCEKNEWPVEFEAMVTALIELYMNDPDKERLADASGWARFMGGRTAERLHYVQHYFLAVLEAEANPEYLAVHDWFATNRPEERSLALLLRDRLNHKLDSMMDEMINNHPADQTGQTLLRNAIEGKRKKGDWHKFNQCLNTLLDDIPKDLRPTRKEITDRWTAAVLQDLTGQKEAHDLMWDIADRV
jgi:hypothetical protein